MIPAAPSLSLPASMPLPFHARGPLSSILLTRLTSGRDVRAGIERSIDLARIEVAACEDVLTDDDLQLSLFVLYASHYGAFDALDADLEWDPELVRLRQVLEAALESALRAAVTIPELPEPRAADVAAVLFAMTSADGGPSLSRFLAKKATVAQAREFLIQRSLYTLREADPHSWAIPRLSGRPKAALVEIQSDEYGGGRPERMHAAMFATAMRGAGLDDAYGAYLDELPAIGLASLNAMSLFGLNRRLLGAVVGHLAAFEMTSSLPNRMYADGMRRLGFGEDVTAYFDEHVEADAVHEQIAGHDLAGVLAEERPELLADILFGAGACLAVDGWVGAHILDCWERGESSLRAHDGYEVTA